MAAPAISRYAHWNGTKILLLSVLASLVPKSKKIKTAIALIGKII